MLHRSAGTVNHHLAGGGEFSTGGMGKFQPALTSLSYGSGRYEIWNRSWGLVDKTLTNFITNMKDSRGRQTHPETTPHNPWGN